MAKAFDRDELLAALDEIGHAARNAGTVLHIAVYGGSALMLASNFRFRSEDVDIAELPKPWPQWLRDSAERIASERGWSADWLNDAVSAHLSRLATVEGDHREFGTFPRAGEDPGLVVYVPTAEYLLALKLKALRVLDPARGHQEGDDILNLMKVVGVTTAEAAVAVMGKYFPRSAAAPEKHLFVLKHLIDRAGAADAPRYPFRSL